MFVLPQRRLASAFFALPPLWTMSAALPYGFILASYRPWSKRRTVWTFRALAVLSAFLLATATLESIYRAVWYSVRLLVPIAVGIGCVFLATHADGTTPTPKRRAEILLLLSTAALLTFIEYPYSYGIYFCYTAPLLILAIASLVCSQAAPPVSVHLCVAWFYLVFAIAYLNTGFIRWIGVRPGSPPQRDALATERSGLRMRSAEAELYTRLIREIQAHSRPDAFIYAAPDCPEVYFLAQRENPTRTMYDFFDRDFGSAGRTQRVLDTLDSSKVEVVVINWHTKFSPHIRPELWRELKRRYPNETRVLPFSVRWRTDLGEGSGRVSGAAPGYAAR
jgi:hypothetical protein